MTSQPTELVQSYTRHDTQQQDETSDNHGPELDLQHVLVEVRLRRKSHSHQHGEQDHVTANTVVLVQLLRVVDTTVQLRNKVLSDANDSLNGHENVRDQAEYGMGRLKVCSVVADLVVLNHDQTSDGG